MRILAIRGQNLASLYGHFEVDLEQEPLAGCGLFGICGPTGAGKSTLLDALCLALFGRTPRLDDRGGAPLGLAEGDPDQGVLTANDTRALLSRGTASGFAEVLFLGVDGQRWRARWSVRRAHDKAGGRLQVQEQTLHDDATGEAVGGKLQETRAEVVSRLGFGFEEFRRAVVLPQFEFSAFLRADQGKRAEILQRVTGTEVYERISRGAHLRAAAEGRARGELEVQAAAQAVLDAPARAVLEAALAEARTANEAAQAELRGAEQTVTWHARAASLSNDVSTAEKANAGAAAALAASAPLRDELAEVERALPYRAELTAAERALGAAARAGEAALAAAVARAAAVDRLAVARAGALTARTGVEEAERVKLRLAPEVLRARAQEAELRAAEAEADRAALEVVRAREALAQASRERDALARQRGEAGAARDRAAAWLASHAASAPLAEGWERWKTNLQQHRTLSEELARARAVEVARGKAVEALARARVEATVAEASATAAALRAQEAAAGAEASAAELDPAALAAEREAADRWLSRLEALASAAGEASRGADAASTALARAEHEEALAQELQARAALAGQELAGADRALAEARRARERALQLKDLASHRAELAEGVPCPLCGALLHPWATGVPASLTDDLASRVEELSEEVGTRTGELAALRQQEALARREAGAAREAAALASKVVASAQVRWGGAREEALGDERAAAAGAAGDGTAASDGVAPHRPDAAALPASAAEGAAPVATALATAQAALEELKRREVKGRERARSAERARRLAEEGRRAASEATLAVAEEVRRHAVAEGEVSAARAACLAKERERGRVEELLEPALAGRSAWPERLRADPEPFIRACAVEAKSYRERLEERKAQEEALHALSTSFEAASALAGERAVRAEQAAAEGEARAAGLAEVAVRRRGALAGRPAEEVEGELASAVKFAAAADEEARAQLGAAETRHAAAVAAEEAKGAEAAATRGEAEVAEATLAAVLAALGCDRTTLARLLQQGKELVSARRAELARLEEESQRAAAALAERRRMASEHEHASGGRPGSDAAAAEARLVEATRQAEEAAEALATRRQGLAVDDAARARVAELGPRLEEARRRARTWEQLSSAIGAADGKKLKVYAQSLTLAALLDAANAHLKDLAPRYRLERVPETDLELQALDLDLGGEARSVNGLSGGESFLVSLALALGLASLTTQSAQVETLFIDEGFGTLDRDALEHALAALDGLRSRGRTVGIISHVPELQERLGAQVRVEPVGTGRSQVRVVGPVAA